MSFTDIKSVTHLSGIIKLCSTEEVEELYEALRAYDNTRKLKYLGGCKILLRDALGRETI